MEALFVGFMVLCLIVFAVGLLVTISGKLNPPPYNTQDQEHYDVKEKE